MIKNELTGKNQIVTKHDKESTSGLVFGLNFAQRLGRVGVGATIAKAANGIYGESKVTHGALFIRRIDSDNIEIVHASSKTGKVVIEPWPLERKVRDQWFVGAGRLMTAY